MCYGAGTSRNTPDRSRAGLPSGSAAWMAPIRAVRHAASGIQKQYGMRSGFIVTIPKKRYNFFLLFPKAWRVAGIFRDRFADSCSFLCFFAPVTITRILPACFLRRSPGSPHLPAPSGCSTGT